MGKAGGGSKNEIDTSFAQNSLKDMPALVGSPKQIAWASEIREKALKTMDDDIKSQMATVDRLQKAAADGKPHQNLLNAALRTLQNKVEKRKHVVKLFKDPDMASAARIINHRDMFEEFKLKTWPKDVYLPFDFGINRTTW